MTFVGAVLCFGMSRARRCPSRVSLGWVLLPVTLVLALPGCERPCTLGIAEPDWCEGRADDLPEQCHELCSVCDGESKGRADQNAKDCRAYCRREIGFGEMVCEDLGDEAMAAYRECVATSDYVLCRNAREQGGLAMEPEPEPLACMP